MKKRAFSLLMALALLCGLAVTASAGESLPFESLTFDYLSGAGAWAGQLILHADGTFEGSGYDEDEDSYSQWAYEGAFRDIQRMGAGAWKMTCERMDSTLEVGPAGKDEVLGEVNNVEPVGPAPDEVWYLYAPGELPLYTEWAETVRLIYGEEVLSGSFLMVCSKDPEALPYAASVEDSAQVMAGYGEAALAMDGGNIYLDAAQGVVKDADGYIQAADIPAKVNGRSVTAIGDGAFENCVQLESVTLPDGVRTVGERAFAGCEALRHLTLPASLEKIGKGAFSGCALTSVTFTGSASGWKKLMGASAGAGLPGDIAVNCAVSDFTDVPLRHWAAPYVDFVFIHGVMTGVGGGRFAPDKPMDLGSAATVLARRLGVDTTGDPWYASGMSWAEKAGLTFGKGAADTLERQELVYMIWKAAGGPADDGYSLELFPDWAAVGDEYVTAMSWAVKTGVINGSDGRLAPEGITTRAEYAAVITRAYAFFK